MSSKLMYRNILITQEQRLFFLIFCALSGVKGMVISMKHNLSRYFQFLLIVLAAGSIYPLIYLRSNYQETILSVFGISLENLNAIYSALGIVFIIGYFPSGWLADKFSAKKLISFSLLICGLAGLWFAQIPSFQMVLVIFVIWGVFSVFTFWSAHLKMVKLIARKEEEGRFFGILDGGRGAVEAILAMIALFIFTNVSGGDGAGTVEALQGVIYLYSFAMLIMSVLILLFVKESSKSSKEEKVVEVLKNYTINLNAQTLKKIIWNKYVWLMGSIIFMGYTIAWMIFYLGGFLQTNIEVNAIRVAQVMVVSLWMRPIGGIVGGCLADKFNKNLILGCALGLAVIGLLALALTPPTVASQLFFEVIIIFVSLMIHTVRGLYWSLLGDCKIDDSVLGLSIGFISLLGYIPDFVAPFVSTLLLTMFGSSIGQNAFFIFGAIMGVVGIILVIIFNGILKHET